MAINLQITPDFEQRLKEKAAREGLDVDTYIIKVLKKQLDRQSIPSDISEEELMAKISLGIAPELWTEYHLLKEKRVAETLSDAEYGRLIEISDKIELANARRMKYLKKLADMKGTSLDSLIQSLGLAA